MLAQATIVQTKLNVIKNCDYAFDSRIVAVASAKQYGQLA
jgi:hypothetical protein